MSVIRAALSLGIFVCFGEAAVRDLSARVDLQECAGESYDGVFFPLTTRFGSLPSAEVVDADPELGSSTPVSLAMDYGENFKVLTDDMAMEQYVLTQCGTQTPSEAEIDAVKSKPSSVYVRKYFTVPLQVAVAMGTSQLHFLEELDVQDRVAYVSEYAVGPCWQMAESCGSQLESSFGNATVLVNQLDEAEAVFMDCSSTSPVDCSNVAARANGVHFKASQVAGALHAAEYVKFMAAFFNKEDVATEFFTTVRESYVSSLLTAQPFDPPVVAWISYQTWSNSLVLSQATYKMNIVTGAGGSSVNGNDVLSQVGSSMQESYAVPTDTSAGKTYTLPLSAFNGSLSEASQAFFAALSDVDAVVDETSTWPDNPKFYTFEDFLRTYGLESNSTLKFIQEGMVFRVDGTLSVNGDYYWFESRVARPDWAFNGLRRVLFADSTQTSTFFRNIAIGESSQELSSDMCETSLPVCEASTYADPIELPDPITLPDATSTRSDSTTDAATSSATGPFCLVGLVLRLMLSW